MVFKWKIDFYAHILEVRNRSVSTHYKAAFLSGEAILISTDELMDKVPMILFEPIDRLCSKETCGGLSNWILGGN